MFETAKIIMKPVINNLILTDSIFGWLHFFLLNDFIFNWLTFNTELLLSI